MELLGKSIADFIFLFLFNFRFTVSVIFVFFFAVLSEFETIVYCFFVFCKMNGSLPNYSKYSQMVRKMGQNFYAVYSIHSLSHFFQIQRRVHRRWNGIIFLKAKPFKHFLDIGELS